MQYDIECVGTSDGWRYRVVLIIGKSLYIGHRVYERHQDALKAARKSGATPVEGVQ